MGAVKVRLLGEVREVERVAARLRDMLLVLNESRDYPSDDGEVRRYLTVMRRGARPE